LSAETCPVCGAELVMRDADGRASWECGKAEGHLPSYMPSQCPHAERLLVDARARVAALEAERDKAIDEGNHAYQDSLQAGLAGAEGSRE